MILVITGMEIHPFARLISKVDDLARQKELNQEVFIQLGSTPYEPKHCRWENYVSFGTICKRIDEASLIITHAGAGSTLNCLMRKKRPIVVPRLKEYGEHIDNHQIPFAEKLNELGLVRLVMNIDDLLPAINKEISTEGRVEEMSGASTLLTFLEEYVAKLNEGS